MINWPVFSLTKTKEGSMGKKSQNVQYMKSANHRKE